MDNIPLNAIAFNDYWVSEDQQLWQTGIEYSSVEVFCRTKTIPSGKDTNQDVKRQSTEQLSSGKDMNQDKQSQSTEDLAPDDSDSSVGQIKTLEPFVEILHEEAYNEEVTESMCVLQ